MENLVEKKKFGKGKVAVAAVILAGVLGLGTLGLYAFSGLFGTALTLSDSFENFGAEVGERIETTPFVSISRLFDALEDGVVSVDADFRIDGLFGLGGNANISFYNNLEQERYALFLSAGALGVELDARVLGSSNSLAFGSDAFIGADNIGINFDTFAEDAPAFFELLGLEFLPHDFEVFNQLFTDMFGTSNDLEGHNFQPYLLLLNNFINGIEQERLQTTVNGVNVDRISLEISNSDISQVLNQFYDVLADDAMLRAAFELNTGWYIENGPSSFDWMLEDLRWAIQDFDNLEEEFLITANFYIDASGRMVQLFFSFAIPGGDFPGRAEMTLNTGTHALDTWTLEATVYEGNENLGAFLLTWDIYNADSYQTNRIVAAFIDEGIATDEAELFSTWNNYTGNFTLGVIESGEEHSFSGLLFVDDYSMTMQFNDISLGGVTINIEISAQSGIPVPTADFINISDLTPEILEDIEAQFEDILSIIEMLGMIF